MTDFFHDLIVDSSCCQNDPEVVSSFLRLLRWFLHSFAASSAAFFFRFAAFLVRFGGFFFCFATFLLRSGHVGRFQFFSINADLVTINIVTLPVLVSGLDSLPSAPPEKRNPVAPSVLCCAFDSGQSRPHIPGCRSIFSNSFSIVTSCAGHFSRHWRYLLPECRFARHRRCPKGLIR